MRPAGQLDVRPTGREAIWTIIKMKLVDMKLIDVNILDAKDRRNDNQEQEDCGREHNSREDHGHDEDSGHDRNNPAVTHHCLGSDFP